MDSAKVKKLQDYASFLAKQAESKEIQGNGAEAARDYVKLVDILLLLANEAKDHPSWQQIVAKVEYYQKKIKTLGNPSEASQVQNKTRELESMKFEEKTPTALHQTVQEKPVDPNAANSPSSLLKSFRKIPGFMGKAQEQPRSRPPDTQTSQVEKPVPSSSTEASNGWMNELPKPRLVSAIESKQEISYSDIASENEKLKARIEALEANEKDYVSTFEEIKMQTEEKISSMVSKEEYELVQLKLLESVPKTEYEKLKETIRTMVPREKFVEAERYISELEAQLENSVPKTVLSQIEEYTSLLISTSSISLVDIETRKPRSLTPIEVPITRNGSQKLTLDIDRAAQSYGEKPESIFLEIKMKPQTPRKVDPSPAMRSGKNSEIDEVQSELSEINGSLATQA